MESKEEKETRTTSFRKPLTDVSNNNNRFIGRSSKREPTRNPIAVKRGGDGAGKGDEDILLDQLSVIRSNLSSLTRQIDELVARAVDSKGVKGEGREEIECFARFLSDMLSSLKPWVPRFEEVVSRPSSGMEDQSVSSRREAAQFEGDGSPQGQGSIMDSLVSPSPLVSWRENGKVGNGRQLFLLTPLPLSKTMHLRHQDLPKLAVERFTLNPDVEVPSFLAMSEEANDELLEGAAIDHTPNKSLNSVTAQVKNASTSNPMLPERDCSVVVMTPCPKLPPPRSSVLPEPASISFHKFNYKARKCTPFPAGIKYNISDSSSGGSSDDLGLMYSELVGIRRAYMPATGKEKIEASPEWPFSSLKTRLRLDPIDDVLNDVIMDHPLPNSSAVINEQPVQSLKHVQEAFENVNLIDKGCSTIVESTPICKESASTMRRGKRPGESTLKKELWSRFEAASTYGLHPTASSLKGTAGRGFMDMLDEVSCDEERPAGDGSK